MGVPTRISSGLGVNHPAPVQSKLVSGSHRPRGVVLCRGGRWLFENYSRACNMCVFWCHPQCVQPPSRVVEGDKGLWQEENGQWLGEEPDRFLPVGGKGGPPRAEPRLLGPGCCQEPCGKSVLGSPLLFTRGGPAAPGLHCQHLTLLRSPGLAWVHRQTAIGLQRGAEPGRRSPQSLGAIPQVHSLDCGNERTPGFLSVLWKFVCIFVASGSGREYNDQFQAPRATLPRIRRRHRDFILDLSLARSILSKTKSGRRRTTVGTSSGPESEERQENCSTLLSGPQVSASGYQESKGP